MKGGAYMAETEKSRLDAVKMLLGISNDESDGILSYVIQTVEQMVLNYINHETLPKELENPIIYMCVSYYKAAGLGTAEAARGPVSSVKRGDVQTSFATSSGSSGSAATFNLGEDGNDFFGWRTTLNQFRRMRW